MAKVKWTPPPTILFLTTRTKAEFVSMAAYKSKEQDFYTYRYLNGIKEGTEVPLSQEQIEFLLSNALLQTVSNEEKGQ